jgi:hypothetical protein
MLRTSFGSEMDVPEDVSESFGSETKEPGQAGDPNLNFQDNCDTTTVGTTCNPRLERQTTFQAAKNCSSRKKFVGIRFAPETLLQIALHWEVW